MATVKVKFRASIVQGKLGSIYFQIIHHRELRLQKTKYRIYPDEWDSNTGSIVASPQRPDRQTLLRGYRQSIKEDLFRLNECAILLSRKNKSYTAKDILKLYQNRQRTDTLRAFMSPLISQLNGQGRVRTGETYQCALDSFMKFRNNEEIALGEITPEVMEAYLKKKNLSLNSISFYMRILRAVYNRAVDKELTIQRFPFKHVYTGIEKTVKRAVPMRFIRLVKELPISTGTSISFARDMFLFSFYTRGMSFVDMAFLKKKDLRNGVLTYRRKKTGQQLSVKWEKCMQEILDKYPANPTDYLLPVIVMANERERQQYKNALTLINRKLKIISAVIHSPFPLSMYVARHSWASIARSKNIPLSIISESMGHDSEATTQIYLASLDSTVVDRANRMILNEL